LTKDRTPHWLIQLRFYLLCSPVGVGVALILAPWALPVLLAFGGTLFLFWHGSRLFTNTFVRLMDAEAYHAHKQSGGDPFYDSIGAPLNNDPEDVRATGYRANTDCPGCDLPVFVHRNETFRCPRCDAHWHDNNWWRWTGSEWVVLRTGRRGLPQATIGTPH
jgi:hypothetical protein